MTPFFCGLSFGAALVFAFTGYRISAATNLVVAILNAVIWYFA